ncbi:MAG: helix-turn-helix domain-containing protein [Myxococcota bacterium]
MEAGVELLREEGLASLSTKRAAAAVGIAQPSFYAHFPNRDAYRAAVLEVVGARLMVAIRSLQAALRQAGPDDPAKIADHFDAMLVTAESERAHLEIFFEHRRARGLLGELARKFEDDTSAEIRAHLDAVIAAEGRTLPGDVMRHAATTLATAAIGLVDQHLRGEGPDRRAKAEIFGGFVMVVSARLLAPR